MSWTDRWRSASRTLSHGKQDAHERIRRVNFYNFAWPIQYTDGTLMWVDARKVIVTGERDGGLLLTAIRPNLEQMTRRELIESLSKPG